MIDREITIKFERHTVRGWYCVLGRTVHVKSERAGKKSAQRPRSAKHPVRLAKKLLRELAQEGKA